MRSVMAVRFAALAVLVVLGGAVAKQGMLRAGAKANLPSAKVRVISKGDVGKDLFVQLASALRTAPAGPKRTVAFTQTPAADVSVFGNKYPTTAPILAASLSNSPGKDGNAVGTAGAAGAAVNFLTNAPNVPTASVTPAVPPAGASPPGRSIKYRLIMNNCGDAKAPGSETGKAMLVDLASNITKAAYKLPATVALTCLPTGMSTVEIGKESFPVGADGLLSVSFKTGCETHYNVLPGAPVAKPGFDWDAAIKTLVEAENRKPTVFTGKGIKIGSAPPKLVTSHADTCSATAASTSVSTASAK